MVLTADDKVDAAELLDSLSYRFLKGLRLPHVGLYGEACLPSRLRELFCRGSQTIKPELRQSGLETLILLAEYLLSPHDHCVGSVTHLEMWGNVLATLSGSHESIFSGHVYVPPRASSPCRCLSLHLCRRVLSHRTNRL